MSKSRRNFGDETNLKLQFRRRRRRRVTNKNKLRIKLILDNMSEKLRRVYQEFVRVTLK